MMGSRGPLKGHDEWDALTGWRKKLILQRGIIRKAKRTYAKRMRRIAKRKACRWAEQLEDYSGS
jgi:hypothetical protein